MSLIESQYDAVATIGYFQQIGLEYVRFVWVDLANFVRYRVIPVEYFTKMLGGSSSSKSSDVKHRPGMAMTKTTFGLVFITMAPGFTATGEYLYVPDIASLKLCGYAPTHATVMGYFEENVPRPLKPNSSETTLECSLCPRTLLRHIVESAKRTHGVDFLIGFETEFILLKSTSPIEAVNNYGWSEAGALLSGTAATRTLEKIARYLKHSGIEVQMYHAEAAPGQYEIVTGPLSPLEAADALIHTRETIFNTASEFGLRATLAPRLHADNCGSGAHTHMSLRSSSPSLQTSANVPSAPRMTNLEASFLQGLLDHLPAASAFALPTDASYARMADGVWSGGTWVCWGKDNRECPVRLCGADMGNLNFELKSVDGTSNPYLMLAAMLSGGMLGVQSQKALTSKDCGVFVAASMNDDERASFGVNRRMPLNRLEARKYLVEDRELVNVLGEELVEKFLVVNETLSQCLKAETEEATTKRLVENF